MAFDALSLSVLAEEFQALLVGGKMQRPYDQVIYKPLIYIRYLLIQGMIKKLMPLTFPRK